MTVAAFESHLASLGRRIVDPSLSEPLRSLASALKAEKRDLSTTPSMRTLCAFIDAELNNHARFVPADDLANLVNLLAEIKFLTPPLMRTAGARLKTLREMGSVDVVHFLRAYSALPRHEADAPWGRELLALLARHLRTGVPLLTLPHATEALRSLKSLRCRDDPELFAALAARVLELLSPSEQPVDPDAVQVAIAGLAAAGFRSFRLRPGYALGNPPQRALPAPLEAGLTEALLRTVPVADGVQLSGISTLTASMGLMAEPVASAPLQSVAEAASRDRLWAAIETRCIQILPSMTMLDVVFMSAAFATVTRRVAHEVLCERTASAAYSAAAGTAAPRRPGIPNGGQLRTPADLDAVVGDRRLWRALRAAVAVHLPAMRPQHVGIALTALATASEHDETLYRDMMRRVRAAVGKSGKGDSASSSKEALRCNNRFNGRFLETAANLSWALFRAGVAQEHTDDVAAMCSAMALLFYDGAVAPAASRRPRSPASAPPLHIEHCLTMLRAAGQATGLLSSSPHPPTPALRAALKQLAVATALRVNLFTSPAEFPRDAVSRRIADTLRDIVRR